MTGTAKEAHREEAPPFLLTGTAKEAHRKEETLPFPMTGTATEAHREQALSHLWTIAESTLLHCEHTGTIKAKRFEYSSGRLSAI